MNHIISKREKRIRRHKAVRSNVSGTAEVPRLAVFRSNKYIYAQLIDDVTARTVVATSDIKGLTGAKTVKAEQVGEELARLAKKSGITKVVFDRGGFRYIGRVKALADGARKGGLIF